MTKKNEVLFSITKDNIWKIATVILAILLVLSWTTGVFHVGSDSSTSGADDRKVVPKKGTVVITEYSDFQCPFCGKFYNGAYKEIKDTYGDKVVFEFKNFPLSFHQFAQKAAEAGECAKDQGKFWEYHNTLFDHQDALAVTDLKKYAGDLGLKQTEFDSCLDSGKKDAIIKADIAQGQVAGITGTPGFIINGQKIVGAQPFAAFKPVIDSALSGAAPVAQPSAPTAPAAKVDVSADDDPVIGKADAPVIIIEFSDFQCPFCGRFYSQTLPQLKKEYIDTGKVKLVYRDFPLPMHQHAQKAAEAAGCAEEQGKFEEFHNKVFENQKALTDENLKAYAGDLGLDQSAFDSCLDSGKRAAEVKKDANDGKAAGVSGTPSFFINGQRLVGAQPFAAFKSIIDAELEK